jgi:hypothetical protein
MPIACPTYYTVRERLRAFLTRASKPQLTNLSLLTFGLVAAGNSQLPRIAAKLPLLTGPASLTQRLRRLLRNKAIEPTTLYQPIARFLLRAFGGGKARLILDATDLGGRLPVLFVAVAYRGRALPLAWRMLPSMGCSKFSEQKALLSEVAALLPSSVEVTLLADREYGSLDMTRWCLTQKWHFCLRLKKNRWFIKEPLVHCRRWTTKADCLSPFGARWTYLRREHSSSGFAGAISEPVLRLEPRQQRR